GACREGGHRRRPARRRRGGPAPPRMDRAAPTRRPAAGRLSHAVPRRGPRPGRPARVPAPRRRALHRLERDGPAAGTVRSRVHRVAGAGGVDAARPQRLGRFRLAASHQAGGFARLRRGARQAAHATRQSRRCGLLWRRGRSGAAGTRRSLAGAADPAPHREPQTAAALGGHRPARPARLRAEGDREAFAGLRRLGLPQCPRLGPATGPARAAPRDRRGAARRSARAHVAGPRSRGDAGRRDRRAIVRRHSRPGLPAAIRAGRSAAREGLARNLHARGRRRPRAVHRRRPGRRDPALRRPAQAPQPTRRWRRAACAPRGCAMSFLWPNMLWLLLAIPMLVGLYLWLLHRRKRVAIRYAGLAMVREAMTASQGWRRHLPPLLFLLSLTAMVVAIARPTAVVTVPSQHETVILAMDV